MDLYFSALLFSSHRGEKLSLRYNWIFFFLSLFFLIEELVGSMEIKPGHPLSSNLIDRNTFQILWIWNDLDLLRSNFYRVDESKNEFLINNFGFFGINKN